MALHTKKQFAELCGLTTGNLSNYEGRHKIVYSGDYVDDSIEPNISFLKKRMEQSKSTPKEEQIVAKKEKPASHLTLHIQNPEPYHPPAPQIYNLPQSDSSILALEKEKLTLQNQKLVQEVELAKKKNEKIAEESVLVEHVRALIIIQSESSKIAWENAVEDLLVNMEREFQLTREQVAKVKSTVNETINNSLVRAAEESRKALKRLQSDYSNKRGKGEKV